MNSTLHATNNTLRSPWAWGPPLVAVLLLVLVGATGSNRALFLFLNHAGHGLGEPFWLNLTLIGDGAVVLAMVLPSIKRSPRCFWAALIAAVIATLFVQGTKQIIDVPRPLAVFIVGEFFQAGPPYRAVSFPSGHAAAIFALTGIWVMGMTRRLAVRLALLGLAVLVSLSRVMVGVHWPLDILGGMLGGWFAAWCGLALQARYRWGTAGIGGAIAGTILLAIAAGLLVSKHVGIPGVMPLQRTLGGVCLLWGGWELRQSLHWLRLSQRLQQWRRRHAQPRLRRHPKGD
jgi:membrane-associated phospholipid phosphatase